MQGDRGRHLDPLPELAYGKQFLLRSSDSRTKGKRDTAGERGKVPNHTILLSPDRTTLVASHSPSLWSLGVFIPWGTSSHPQTLPGLGSGRDPERREAPVAKDGAGLLHVLRVRVRGGKRTRGHVWRVRVVDRGLGTSEEFQV